MAGWHLFQDQLLPQEDVHISPQDRGYYFGDGIYEVFRVYHGKLYEADAHFDRLERTAAAVRIPLPASRDALLARVISLTEANQIDVGLVYMQITRGAAPRNHPFPAAAEPVLFAYANELPRPAATIERGITAITAADIRWHRCDLKTLNLLPNVLAKQEAVDRGADDAILHRDGTVTESSASNVMIVKDGAIYTHPADQWILHGITRAVTLRLAGELGIPVHEVPFTLEQLVHADEIFVTGTTIEVTPVIAVNGAQVASGQAGPITKRLQQAFVQTIPST